MKKPAITVVFSIIVLLSTLATPAIGQIEPHICVGSDGLMDIQFDIWPGPSPMFMEDFLKSFFDVFLPLGFKPIGENHGFRPGIWIRMYPEGIKGLDKHCVYFRYIFDEDAAGPWIEMEFRSIGQFSDEIRSIILGWWLVIYHKEKPKHIQPPSKPDKSANIHLGAARPFF